MFSRFIPETELERTFVQAKNWDADVLWRRCVFYMNRQRWSVSAALMLCLALHYARDDAYDHQNQTLASISGLLAVLSSSEKYSLFGSRGRC